MQSKNKVIMAAAGSGKTWGICNSVIKELEKTTKNILITTYTNKGVEAIINEFKNQNMGVLDCRVIVKTWYQFILSEMVKPYQSSVLGGYSIVKSIDFTKSYGFKNFNKKGL